jgi:hypothetical protein
MNKAEIKSRLFIADQIDKMANGNVINRFCSIKDAATALKVSAGHICDCLRGKRGKTGGFKWAYAN